jgi:hypothetical protein
MKCLTEKELETCTFLIEMQFYISTAIFCSVSGSGYNSIQVADYFAEIAHSL